MFTRLNIGLLATDLLCFAVTENWFYAAAMAGSFVAVVVGFAVQAKEVELELD